MPLKAVAVTRYVTPLREGGSLPALVEADDDGLYVLKFRAAGHGLLALVAELVAGEIGRALGLPVPEIVLATLDGDLARTEPDPEIHALIHDSAGLNLALDYLPGAVNFDRSSDDCGSGVARRMVRRVGQQRRSHAAQYQYADVAPRAVADRSRVVALLPPLPRLGGRAAAGARAVCRHQGSRAAAPRVADPRGGPGAGGAADARCRRRDRRSGAGGLADRSRRLPAVFRRAARRAAD